MSVDAEVTQDLIETLENGKNGFEKAAGKLSSSDFRDLAAEFVQFGQQRNAFSTELTKIAETYGDELKEKGTVAGAAHRGWLAVKDALAGDDADGVVDAALQGEEHAVSEFDKALAADISPELRAVVERQAGSVRTTRDRLTTLQASLKSKSV